MSKTNFNTQEWAKTGFQDFIVPTMMDAPHTEIDNRAQIPTGLEVRKGIQRFYINGIRLSEKEIEQNGRVVWIMDDDNPFFRACGGGWTFTTAAQHAPIRSQTTNDLDSISDLEKLKAVDPIADLDLSLIGE